mmetsp:Transcript_30807/g.98187  ORF Transcript_30807/g.98187 Transcript_30807/m.98187 type:complete len:253 (-) Transcript_30807:837-1595(-)
MPTEGGGPQLPRFTAVEAAGTSRAVLTGAVCRIGTGSVALTTGGPTGSPTQKSRYARQELRRLYQSLHVGLLSSYSISCLCCCATETTLNSSSKAALIWPTGRIQRMPLRAMTMVSTTTPAAVVTVPSRQLQSFIAMSRARTQKVACGTDSKPRLSSSWCSTTPLMRATMATKSMRTIMERPDLARVLKSTCRVSRYRPVLRMRKTRVTRMTRRKDVELGGRIGPSVSFSQKGRMETRSTRFIMPVRKWMTR